MSPIITAALEKTGIKQLNPMQEAMLRAAGEQAAITLHAPTGSGKTLAFLLPILESIDPAVKTTQALIVAPSRELAQQIESVWKSLGTGHKVTCCYGGHKREIEENSLTEAPVLIVGTPGRLADHLRRGNIATPAIQTLVLDEFDKCLELGFESEMTEVIKALSGLQRRFLTSATVMDELPAFTGITDPLTLEFEGPEKHESLELALRVVHSPEHDKLTTLFELLCFTGARPTIIFCNHRDAVERVSADMKARGIHNVFYHGAMEQMERDTALCKFRNGSSDFLVTTDLAARGLDIAHIRYIIHYHLPDTESSFTHRNGRTARMEASGTAILLLGPDEKLPVWVDAGAVEQMEVPAGEPLPAKPDWSTLYIAAGKKNKVNKVDIVGFLAQIGGLKKEDIGLIEVKDFSAFAAVRRSKASVALTAIRDQKLKGKKVKIAPAR